VSRLLATIISSCAILILVLTIVAAAQSLTVAFNKPVYDMGDVVSIKVRGLQPPATLGVEVYSPDGRLVWVHEEDNIPYNETILSFKLPDTAPEGIYKVYIAVSGGTPSVYTFTVHRPEFIITSATISPPSVETGKPVTISVSVKNVGAEGSFYIVVLDQNNRTVTQIGPLTLGYSEVGSYQAAFTAPERPGTFTYTVETVNVKYGTIDSFKKLQLYVHYPPPPPVPVAPPPPPPTTPITTPARTATTTSPPPNATSAFAAYIADIISPRGVVAKAVKIRVPAIGVEVSIPAGTLILGPTGTPVHPTKIIILLPSRVPKPKPPNIMVGPPVDIRFEGYSHVTFNQSVMVTVPYEPEKVPPGYEVRLSYYDPKLGEWVPLPTTKVDPFTGRVTGLTRHFTVFAAIAYRVVTTVTATVPLTVTTTKPVTTTVTSTKTVTTTVPAATTTTTTVTATKTVKVATTVPPITLTKTVLQPVTITKTTAYTVTSTATYTTTLKQTTTLTASPTTIVTTATKTVTKTKTPGWAYASLAAVVILVVAVIILALRRGGTSAGRGA
jgi:hypothetical protein